MPPVQILSLVEERISLLEQALKLKQASVKRAPEGQVRIAVRKGQFQFYKRETPSDKEGKYLPRSQDDLAHALIQRDYDQKTIPALEAELKYLKNFRKTYKNKCSDKVYTSLSEHRRQLVKPMTLTDDPEYAARAAEKIQLYQENGFFPGKNLIITSETTKKPLSSKILKEIIKTFLI